MFEDWIDRWLLTADPTHPSHVPASVAIASWLDTAEKMLSHVAGGDENEVSALSNSLERLRSAAVGPSSPV
jgi:hypothetical protein